jgi:hypothetical protein
MWSTSTALGQTLLSETSVTVCVQNVVLSMVTGDNDDHHIPLATGTGAWGFATGAGAGRSG